MSNPAISLVASAVRPEFWYRVYNSLLQNKTSFEIIFVGPRPCQNVMPENFIYIPANVKPAQCYEIGLRAAQGEIVGWTADDANYNHSSLNCPHALDIVYQRYINSGDPKLILAMSTYEDGNNVSECHRFFFNQQETPRMAPFGFMNREWMRELGGYDRNFVCGQSENDLVMRALADGGRVELLQDAKVYVHHGECHGDYPFRSGYDGDREFLESCWLVNDRKVSPIRVKTFMPFTDYELRTVNQGPAGQWEHASK